MNEQEAADAAAVAHFTEGLLLQFRRRKDVTSASVRGTGVVLVGMQTGEQFQVTVERTATSTYTQAVARG